MHINKSETLLSQVQHSLNAIQQRIKVLKITNAVLIYTNLGASVFSTLITSTTASMGPVMGAGNEGYVMTCWVIAALTALAALSSGLQERFRIAHRLAQARIGANKLRSMTIGLSLTERDPVAVALEYEKFSVEFGDFLH